MNTSRKLPEDNLHDLIIDVLNRRTSGKPNSILTNSYENAIEIYKSLPTNILLKGANISDGVGDFRNLMDYYLRVKATFSGCPNTKVKAVALTSIEKFPALLNVLPDKTLINELYFYDFTEEFNEEAAKKANVIIIGCDKKIVNNKINQLQILKDVNEAINFLTVLRQIFQSADYVFNIAVPWHYLVNQYGNKYLAKNCMIQSILEYGPVKFPVDILKFYDSPINEVAMGVTPKDCGIKLNPEIYNMRENTIEEQIKIIQQSELKNLLLNESMKKQHESTEIKYQFSDEVIRTYLENTFIGIGYLQIEKATMAFLKLLIATSVNSNRSVDAFVNLNKVNLEELKLIAELSEFSRIEIYTIKGELKTQVDFDSSNKKLLRLIGFNGISNEEYYRMITLALIVAGSGDNSVSEVLASGKFPFIQIIPWKFYFIEELVKCIKDIYGQNELTTYLDLLLKAQDEADNFLTNEQVDTICSYAIENFDSIKNTWSKFKEYIYENLNAQVYFNESIMSIVLSQLINHAEPDAIKPLIEDMINRIGVTGRIANFDFPYMAKIKENDDLQSWLTDLLSKSTSPLDENYYCLLGLQLAVVLGDIALVKAFVDANVSLDLPLNDANASLLQLALEHNNIEMIKYLAENMDPELRVNDEEMTPLKFALSQNNFAVVKILVKAGVNVNDKDIKETYKANWPLEIKQILLEALKKPRKRELPTKFFSRADKTKQNQTNEAVNLGQKPESKF